MKEKIKFIGKDTEQSIDEALHMKHSLKSTIKDIEIEILKEQIEQLEIEKEELRLELIKSKNNY